MAGNDIGVTFIPSEANQMAQGPRQGASEGDLSAGRSSDLGQAFKILSLQLPRVVSAAAPTSASLLKAPGASGLPGAPPAPSAMPGAPSATMDPMAAVFAALLRSLQFGSAAPVGGAPSLGGGGAVGAPDSGGGLGAPKITVPANTGGRPLDMSPTTPPDVGSDAPPQQDYQSWAGSY